jgi:hypothetical protein
VAGAWYPGDYDFRNVVTLTGGWKHELLDLPWYERLRAPWWFKVLTPIMPLADRIEISARFRYCGGRPYTPLDYDTTYHRWVLDLTRPNGDRYEPYHRLDLRFERRYGFGFLHMIYYIDLQNLYGRDNVWTYLYNDTNGSRARISQLPFFPAGGLIIGF